MRRAPVTLATAIAAVAALVPGAGAATEPLTIRDIDATRLPLVSVVAAAPGTDVAAGKTPAFVVTENGKPVKELQVEAPTGGAQITLGVDTSQSMRGAPLASAVAAARKFIASKRPDDAISIVTFSDRISFVRTPTTDPAQAIKATDQIEIGEHPGTLLWDGVANAVHATDGADKSSRRVMILLSDGNETSSDKTLQDAITEANASGVTIHVVAIQSKRFDGAPLQQLANETGGSYREATDIGQLQQIYAEIRREIASTYVLRYRSSASGSVALELAVGSTTADATYDGGSAAVVPPPPENGPLPRSFVQAPWSLSLVAALAGIVMLLVGLLLFPRKTRGRLAEILRPYDNKPSAAASISTAERARAGTSRLTTTTERVLGRMTVWRTMAELLDRADIPLRTAELFYIMIGSGLGLTLPAVLVGAPPPVRFILLGVGFILPAFVVRLKARRRERAFDDQLPDLLVAMAASLKAGHSFNQAVDAIIRDGSDPASTEFARAAQQIRLGRSADEALENMAVRLNSKNFKFVVLCVNIQRQVGGSLAELLDTVADTVRERHKFARKVKALVAMGKMSAYALIALPFVMAFLISLINPDYMKPLYSSGPGRIMLFIAVGLVLIGSVILRKIVNQRTD